MGQYLYNKMLSEAGRSYDKTRVVSPYRTRQRFRYYQLPPVELNKPEPKLYQTLDTNLRQKTDSFLLRYAKDITIKTNHSPDYTLSKPTSPQMAFPKAPLVRFIGDVRDEDYTKPLKDNCDHRCAHANNVNASVEKDKDSTMSSRQNSQFSELPFIGMQSGKNASLTTIEPTDLKKLQLSDFKSTEHSLVKKRSKIVPKVEKESAKEHARGVSFGSSIGHQYLSEVDNRQRYPQCYDIEKANQGMVRKSMRQPSIHVRFGQFRNSVATRYDRADPHWHLSIDSSSDHIPQKDLSYDFKMHSERKINEVKSKYPFRQCMNFYIFPTKKAVSNQE